MEEHKIPQSQEENLSMPLENEELEIEFIQPNPTFCTIYYGVFVATPFVQGLSIVIITIKYIVAKFINITPMVQREYG